MRLCGSVLGSIKKQTKGARLCGMRHQAKTEGFMVSLRYIRRQEEEQNNMSGERSKGREGNWREGEIERKKEMGENGKEEQKDWSLPPVAGMLCSLCPLLAGFPEPTLSPTASVIPHQQVPAISDCSRGGPLSQGRTISLSQNFGIKPKSSCLCHLGNTCEGCGQKQQG